MARVSATASLSARVGTGHKKDWGSHDGVTPNHSITLERGNLSDELSDEDLADKAKELHTLARGIVEKLINEDIRDLRAK